MKLLKIIKSIFDDNSFSKSYRVESDRRNSKKKRYYLRKLWPFIKPYWKQGLFASILLVISTLLTIPIPLFTKYILDDVIVDKNIKLLTLIIIILTTLFILGGIVSFIQRYIFFTFEQRVILSIQHKLFNRVLRFPKSFFDSKHTGYLLSRLIGDVYRLRMLFSDTMVEIFTSILKFIGTVIILFVIHYKLALISMFILPFFITSVSVFGKKMKVLSHVVMEKSALVSRYLNESLAGLEIVKAFAAEKKESQKIYNSLSRSVDATVTQNTISSFSQFIISLIGSIGTILVLWFGTREILANRLTIGSFMAFNGYLGYFYGPARFLTRINIHLQPSFAALERVFSLYELIPEDEEDNSKIKIKKLKGRVEFVNVSFSYNDKLVLRNISFKTNPGQFTAIVGPTGAGKSTLINLIISLYKVSKGKILFDGIDLERINLHSLRERIGIVSQETFLFDDTIANNIRYGNLNSEITDVIRAAKMANAHEFIIRLKDGYNTTVGEKGVKLSVGQRQRISIARALLKDPDILIFDEPTSALDAITEKTIKDILFNKRLCKTIFVIAHRLSTVMKADMIVVLDRGRIVDTGTHKELIEQDGLYRNMCEEQAIVK